MDGNPATPFRVLSGEDVRNPTLLTRTFSGSAIRQRTGLRYVQDCSFTLSSTTQLLWVCNDGTRRRDPLELFTGQLHQ